MQSTPANETSGTNRDIDVSISEILRFGVVFSSILVAIGGAAHLANNWNEPFAASDHDLKLRTISGIISLISEGHAEGVIQLGVIVLLCTPILRVAFAGLAFLKQKDYVYVLIACLVLAGLGYSLLFSDGHGG